VVVSAGKPPVELGTDTGGSVRIPASPCISGGYRLAPAYAGSLVGCLVLETPVKNISEHENFSQKKI
jgi:hypothetical protein